MIYKKKNNLIYLSSILLTIFPVSLITGPFIPEIIIFFLNIIFLLSNNSIKKILKYCNFLIYVLFIFNILIIISSILSLNIIFSLKNSFFFFRYIIFVMSVCWIYEKNPKIINYIFYSFSFSFFILFLFLLPELIFNYNILLGEKIGLIKDSLGNETGHAFSRFKNSSLFGDEWIMGSYISRFFCFYIGIYFILESQFKKKVNKIFFFSIFTALFCVFFSGERLSFFFIIIAIFMLILLLKIFLKVKYILLISILLFFSILFTFTKQKERLIYQTSKQILSTSTYLYSPDHESHIMTAYSIFKYNKFFGVGPKNFIYECKNKKYLNNNLSCSNHPHNFLFQLLSETGLFGLLIPFGIFLIICMKLINNFFTNSLNAFHSQWKFF